MPFEAPPAAYAATQASGGGAAAVRKVAVVIADGGFDTAFCVATTSSGAAPAVLPDAGSPLGPIPTANCLSPNGSSRTQALALCDAMKRSGVSIFTVTYPANTAAADPALMAGCASSQDTALRANTPADLLVAVREIALRLTTLILSR